MPYLVLSLSRAAANTCARSPQITHSSMHHHHHPATKTDSAGTPATELILAESKSGQL